MGIGQERSQRWGLQVCEWRAGGFVVGLQKHGDDAIVTGNGVLQIA